MSGQSGSESPRQGTFGLTGRRAGLLWRDPVRAGQRVVGGVLADRREGRGGRLAAAAEEVRQEVDGVRHVHLAVVVRVAGLLAAGLLVEAAELPPEEVDRVADVDGRAA